jgi:predicted enzyme related to lactoylglutathione lyase
MGRPITHFEIASPNLESASEFYRQLFDWTVGEERLVPAASVTPTRSGSSRGHGSR